MKAFLLAAIVCGVTSIPALADQRWRASLLPAPVGLSGPLAYALNDNGDVVGVAKNQDDYFHPVRWHNGTPTDLFAGTPFLSGTASGINASGAISGEIDDNHRAFRWSNGNFTSLPNSAGWVELNAYGPRINAGGAIVSSALHQAKNDGLTAGQFWTSNAPQLIQPNSYLSIYAVDLNDSNEIVLQAGSATEDDVPAYASIVVRNGKAHLLQPETFAYTVPVAINNAGLVAALAVGDAFAEARAVLMDQTHTTVLEPLDGYASSEPTALNDHGDAAGRSKRPGGTVPTFWPAGSTVGLELQSLVDGLGDGQIETISDINNNGDMTAIVNLDGQTVSVLLTRVGDVPEPTMLAATFALATVVAHRRFRR